MYLLEVYAKFAKFIQTTEVEYKDHIENGGRIARCSV